MNRIVLLVIYVLVFHCYSVYGNDTETDLEKAYVKAVTGDVRPILSVFNSIEDVNQSELAELFGKYEKRFITADEQIEFDDPFITSLYCLYATYWRSSLLDPNDEKKSKKILVSGLNKLSKVEGRKAALFETSREPNIDTLETFFIKTAKERGYYLLMGRTKPLLELMIWKKEERITCHIELPTDSFSVNVVFVQDFLSKGWLGYATFDEKHTGGWYKGDTIYNVGAKPGNNNERFRVSLLGHEGRHISDEKLYGNLESWILEYRAKLTELLLADKSFWKLLNGFKDQAKDNVSVPHAYASYRLMNDLMSGLTKGQETKSFRSLRFEDYSKEGLKKAMEFILDKNTKSLEAKKP